MEEKRLYELTISPKFENALPRPQEAEFSQLKDMLLTEGCRDALVVFHGTLIDGHSRYRICHECGIPFNIMEMEFDDEDAALLWIVENQLSRRNVSDFAKCELVLRLEPKLREELERVRREKISQYRSGMRQNEMVQKSAPSDGQDEMVQNSAPSKKARDQLAKMAGVSHDTLTKVKKLLESAPSETLEQLRSGSLNVNKAFISVFKPEEQRKHEEAVRRSKEMDREIASVMPGYGLAVPLPPREEGIRFRPPDSVLDIPPITVFGNMPADDPKYRGRAEMAYAKGEFQKNTDYYTDRAAEILQWMSSASINPENLEILREIVKNGYEKIMKLIGGYENEDQ